MRPKKSCRKKKKSDMLSEVTLHLFMLSRGIGINLNLLEINLVNTVILDVGLFYVLGDVLGNLLNDRLRAILSELFQRKERYLTSFYKLVRAGKVVSFSCVESWRIVYGESVLRMAAKAKILATSQLLKEFRPHVKAVSPGLRKLVENGPVFGLTPGALVPSQEASSPTGELLEDFTLPSYGNLVGLDPIRKREKVRRLTELARRQAEGMPAYEVFAMRVESKQILLKEYCTYVSDKFDTAFLERKLTCDKWSYVAEVTSDQELLNQATKLSRCHLAPWRRFVRPEWSLSVASTVGTKRIYWVVENLQFSDTFWEVLGPSRRARWHRLESLGLQPKTLVEVVSISNSPPQTSRSPADTGVAFFLGDGRVYKYFSGRLLSIVVSALSRCS